MYDCALNKQVLLTSAGLCLCLRAHRAFSTYKEPELLRDNPNVTRLRQHTPHCWLHSYLGLLLTLLGSLPPPPRTFLTAAQGGGGGRKGRTDNLPVGWRDRK